jgi:hypothetical protein
MEAEEEKRREENKRVDKERNEIEDKLMEEMKRRYPQYFPPTPPE